MAVLPLRLFGDPVLRTPAQPVTEFDDRLARLVGDMFDTMDDAAGVGLAAPQVGVPRRVFTFDSGDEGERAAIVNPRIVWRSTETHEGEEGCLSIPGVYFNVVRAESVRLEGVDPAGAPVHYEAHGFLARIFQHETDHLDGVLFVERLSPELRKEAMRLIREQAMGLAPAPQRPAQAL